MKKWVYFILCLGWLTACSMNGKSEPAPSKPSTPIEVTFKTIPEAIQVNQPTTLQVMVKQGKNAVEDASDVQFEVWKKGQEKHQMVRAKHQGKGVYTAEKTFDSEGMYFVTYHVTAKDMHSMKQMELTVGDINKNEEEMDKNTAEQNQPSHSHDHSSHHEHHGLTIELSPTETGKDQNTVFKINVQHEGKSLTNAHVTLEYWTGQEEKHTYVDAKEQSAGEYVANIKLSSSGEYHFRVHALKGELHDHKIIPVHVK
jgi:hypothetical protein